MNVSKNIQMCREHFENWKDWIRDQVEAAVAGDGEDQDEVEDRKVERIHILLNYVNRKSVGNTTLKLKSVANDMQDIVNAQAEWQSSPPTSPEDLGIRLATFEAKEEEEEVPAQNGTTSSGTVDKRSQNAEVMQIEYFNRLILLEEREIQLSRRE
ncbi:Protein CBG24824 [Caenorhabditis briggsae]|uniref:Protein CBG24824 n=1 Tax=Caenorhabditis briggsae TaxID=6238 RepID=A8WLK6_CAEBR|nr:Protein CBG24824 [Caenorhabditis briggsae]CAP21351.2 Protein CBG24824 [Caenorhabditis briggsae]